MNRLVSRSSEPGWNPLNYTSVDRSLSRVQVQILKYTNKFHRSNTLSVATPYLTAIGFLSLRVLVVLWAGWLLSIHEVYAEPDVDLIFVGEFGSFGTEVGQFNKTRAVAVDGSNRIVIADRENHRVQICDDQGTCSAFGQQGNQAGEFNRPQGITVDGHEHIIVSDFGTDLGHENRVQICDDHGTCTAFGGEGSELGQFNGVQGIDVDSQDRIFVADSPNERVQICDHQGVCEAIPISIPAGLEVRDKRSAITDRLEIVKHEFDIY